MELESSYRLLNVLRDDGIRTYRAIEIASGQELEIHVFAREDSVQDRSLFKSLRALPVSKRRELLELGVDGETPYVITEKLPDGTTAREWLGRMVALPVKANPIILAGTWKAGTPIPEELTKSPHHAASGPGPAPPPDKVTPDYTRVMRLPLGGVADAPQVIPTEVKAPAEVKRLADVKPVAEVRPAAAPQGWDAEQVEESTRIFQERQPARQPDELTAMFVPKDIEAKTPPVESATAPPWLQSGAPAAAPAPPVEPSFQEATRMFQGLKPSPAEFSLSSQPAPNEPDEFTRMFSEDVPEAGTPPIAPGRPAAADAPGAFTKYFDSLPPSAEGVPRREVPPTAEYRPAPRITRSAMVEEPRPSEVRPSEARPNKKPMVLIYLAIIVVVLALGGMIALALLWH